MPTGNQIKRSKLKEQIHEIIFEADTPLGRFFDIALLITISTSVLVVILESVGYIQKQYAGLFFILEWIFTIIFTLEYGLRLYCVYQPLKYATSFFGITFSSAPPRGGYRIYPTTVVACQIPSKSKAISTVC